MLTAASFEATYAARSGITVEQLRMLGRLALPCYCQEEGCEGWQMIHERYAEEAMLDLAFRLGFMRYETFKARLLPALERQQRRIPVAAQDGVRRPEDI